MNDNTPEVWPTPSIELPENWFQRVHLEDVVDDQPGIYEWHIEGAGSYIGKYTRISRPTKEYGRNVLRILNNKPYHNGGEFRYIHKELVRAHREGRQITLTILENVPAAELSGRERELIAERGSLNVPPYGRRQRVTTD